MVPVKIRDGKGLNSSENVEIPRNPRKTWEWREIAVKTRDWIPQDEQILWNLRRTWEWEVVSHKKQGLSSSENEEIPQNPRKTLG